MDESNEEKRAEERLEYLNSVLRAIRNVNQLITKEKDRDRLIKGVCENLIETRGYLGAWCTVLDESGRIVTTAEAGLDEDFLPMVKQLRSSKFPDCAQRALKQSGVVIIKDPQSECAECPLLPKESDRGSMAIRLEYSGKVYGLLCVFTSKKGLLDEEEQVLFKDVAGDIALALHNMEMEEERKRAEEALKQSEERYRTLVEESFDGIFVQKGPTIVFANGRLHDMLGYEEGEMLGMDHWLVYHPEYQELTRERARARMRGEEVTPRYEVKLQRKDGAWFYGEVNARPITFDGEPGVQVWVKDIMERKQAEEAVRESEARFKSLSENAPDIIYTLGLEGSFTYVNPAWEKILGYKREEVIGRYFVDFVRKEDARDYVRIFKRIRDKREVLGDIEITILHKDGSTRIFSSSGAPSMNAAGGVTGMVGLFKDITDRRRMEAQLQQAMKMEALGTLAGGIAHDFNNILSAIIGYTEIAGLHLPDGNKARESLKQVLKASYRARDLVRQIVAFSRQTEEEKKPIYVHLIVKEALKLLRASLPSTIEIRQDIASQSEMVLADPTQIHQVLMNLCTNAHHAMREQGGILAVSLKPLELGVGDMVNYPDLKPGPYLELSVSDTGHGMDPSTLKRIFDPYFTTKEKGMGTGLGLSVVHGIVTGHGGIIKVYSEPGRGSIFHVFLPRVKKGEKPESKEFESRPEGLPGGNERILFVDDEATLIDIGREMLERLGYEVITEESPEGALKAFSADPDRFDLVVTDMTMPHMTGDKLAKELMKVRPDIPVILSTGFSERMTPEKAEEIGIRGFMMKPLVLRDLAHTVRKALDY